MQPVDLLDLRLPPEIPAAAVKLGQAADKAREVFGDLGEASTVADVASTLFWLRLASFAVIGFCIFAGFLLWRRSQ